MGVINLSVGSKNRSIREARRKKIFCANIRINYKRVASELYLAAATTNMFKYLILFSFERLQNFQFTKK